MEATKKGNIFMDICVKIVLWILGILAVTYILDMQQLFDIVYAVGMPILIIIFIIQVIRLLYQFFSVFDPEHIEARRKETLKEVIREMREEENGKE